MIIAGVSTDDFTVGVSAALAVTTSVVKAIANSVDWAVLIEVTVLLVATAAAEVSVADTTVLIT